MRRFTYFIGEANANQFEEKVVVVRGDCAYIVACALRQRKPIASQTITAKHKENVMKVYVLISATAQPGKHHEAHKAVAETVKYLRASNAYVGVYGAIRPMHGPNSQVAWLCEYNSLMDYEKDVERRGEDPEWAKVFEAVDQTVDVENVTSQVFRVLEA